MSDEEPDHHENVLTELLKSGEFPSGPIALHCKSVEVGCKGENELARVSIVDYHGNALYDVICQPKGIITNYRTRYTGIWPHHMEHALPFQSIQDDVKKIIENRTLVGHLIAKDLANLDLSHPEELLCDINDCEFARWKARMMRRNKVPLKVLATELLDSGEFEVGEYGSVEDARAIMAIHRIVEDEMNVKKEDEFDESTNNDHF